ncbi:MAG: hypothetical protein ACQESR_16910 [Planctomycetota bacterium]
MESCPTQAVLPLVGLAAEKVIRERYKKAYTPVLEGSSCHLPGFGLTSTCDAGRL